MLGDILRFNAAAKRAAASPASIGESSIDTWLDAGRYGVDFRRRYLLPMAGCIWSCSVAQAAAFPARTFIEFYQRHGLLDIVGRPQWRHVVGGSQVYLRRLLDRFRGELRLGAGVTSIRRGADGVRLVAGGSEERFDQVVSAAHPDQLLACLADADPFERSALGAIGYAPNEAWLHTDTTLLPKRRAVWSSWNYLGSEARSGARGALDPAPICLSYWMNQLQHIPGDTDYIVTLNPPRPPKPDSVIRRMTYHHPQYTAAAIDAQRRLPAIQGRGGLWLCGAWTGYGFHEDGLRSAIEVAARLGCRPPWNAGPATDPSKATIAGAREVVTL
jgi:predicted NAD/FAD-binding protein